MHLGHPNPYLAKLRAASLLVGVATWFLAPKADAEGKVGFQITLEGTTVLYYTPQLDLHFGSAALSRSFGYLGQGVDERSDKSDSLGAFVDSDDGESPDTITFRPSGATTVELTIKNVWELRAITSSGISTVSTTVTNSILSNTVYGAGTDIVILHARVSDGSTAGDSIHFRSPGLKHSRAGHLILELDISKATHSGTYETGTLTLQASSP